MGAKLREVELKAQGIILDLQNVALALQDMDDPDEHEFFDGTAKGLKIYLDAWRIKHHIKAPYVIPPPPLTNHHD